MKTLIVYHSEGGITERMAKSIAQGASEGGEVIVKEVAEAKIDDLLSANVIVLGSPTYFANMSWQMKKFIDESVEHYGKLKGRRGGCFVSSATRKDGESALHFLKVALEIHGMEVLEGPVCLGVPTEEELRECEEYGRRLVQRGGA